ncbi:hypothetical protein JCM8202_005070 [Rhodotorula sphaerocarpa]
MAITATSDSQLGSNVIPSHYDLVIRTDLQNLTFSGTAEIRVTVHEASSAITLHTAAPLRLEAAVLGEIDSSGEVVALRQAERIVLDETKQRAQLAFGGGEIGKGEYQIGLRWKGTIDDTLVGYFRAAYEREGDPELAYYAITQFEPCHARKAFPCFDEPALKASFSISLISRVGTVSLSNAEVKSVERLGSEGKFPRTKLLDEQFFSSSLDVVVVNATEKQVSDRKVVARAPEAGVVDDWEMVQFAATPKMSTYLAAWANGDFEYLESSYTSPLTNRVVPLRVLATRKNIAQGDLLLETTCKILPLYEEIFDIEYPLSKLDTLVVDDFQGAMENWGLIIGHKRGYLWDPIKSGLQARKGIVSMQSHEVAHQWFGNVVTMEWWDNLWLNESFATIMGEVIIPDRIEPSWRVHSSFITKHLARALSLDALRSSHPIEMPCPNEDTIQQIFDALTYSKGASCLKMLSNFVGEDKFLKGVSIYLKKHLYGNARTEDLMAGISEASGQDVGKMMHNWLSTTGFPLITVEETETGLKVRQNRFLATADVTPEEDQTLWYVPLQLLVVDSKPGKSKVHAELVLSERETTINIPDVANTVYKLNAETCGVYRTLYPTSRLSKLGAEAGKGKSSAFSLNDRMGLVQDAAVTASSGYSKTSGSLELLSQMKGEGENLVWKEVSTALGSIISTWWEQPTDVREALAKFRRDLFKPLASRLGFVYQASDDADTTELRTTALSVLAEAGDEETLAAYRRRFEAFMEQNDDSGIPGDLKTSIYSESVRRGGEKEYEKVLEVYRAPPTPAHELSAIAGLCSPSNLKQIDRTLGMILSGEIKTSNVLNFCVRLCENPAAKRRLWSFFKENYETFESRYRAGWTLAVIVSVSFSKLTSFADAEDAEQFFRDKDTSPYRQWLDQGLEAVRASAKWLERDEDDVKEWLRSGGYL